MITQEVHPASVPRSEQPKPSKSVGITVPRSTVGACTAVIAYRLHLSIVPKSA